MIVKRGNKMNEYKIEKANKEECGFIDDQIVAYNISKVPFTQEPSFVGLNRVIKDDNGNVIAGILGVLYCWNCLYIDVLWVDEEYRNSDLGSKLLQDVEEEAKSKGSKLVHLDTFDFQAKEFYIKQGYSVFGELDNCPEDHKRYFMSKTL